MLKYLLNSTAKIIFIVVVFAVLVVLNLYVWRKDNAQEQQIVSLQKQLHAQQQENAIISQLNNELKQKIDSLRQGSLEMIEEEARNGFGMVGEGETFYHFKDKKEQP